MKTILFAFTMLAAVFAHAAYVRPNMNSADSATLATALEAATTTDQKVFVSTIIEINAKAPASFAELCQIVDRMADKYSATETTRVYYKKMFAYSNKKCRGFIREAALFCIENPTRYDSAFITGKHSAEFFTQPQVYTIAMRCLLNNDLAPDRALQLITALVAAAESANVDAVKADLAKLNRRYSLRLVENKTAWTPVVQAIRTAMETF